MSPLHRCVRVTELAMEIEPFALASQSTTSPYQALLESRGTVSPLARYSFFCTDPFLVFRVVGGRAHAGPPGALVSLSGEPLAELSALLARYGRCAPRGTDARTEHDGAGDRDTRPAPFLGGAVGYLGYELLEVRKGVPARSGRPLYLPDAYMMLCDTVFGHDAQDKRSWVAVTGFGADAAAAAAAADHKVALTLARVSTFELAPPPRDEALRERARRARRARPRLTETDVLAAGIRPVLDRDAYLDIVRAAQERIAAGDVYEVCTSNRFETTSSASGAELYRVLSTISEAPFASHLRFPEVEIISSSPERFLRLDRDRWVETRPIKGTRPRGSTATEDARLRTELATSEKDGAENVMIVDLARNDLGRVCELGSVTVPELRIVETYPFTHQLVSTVRGRLRPELDAIDLVRAAFPGGSMTGAPKIEAMTLIDRLEPVERGVYAGAIGYFDFDGAIDLDIVIRTLLKRGNAVTFHVGGAVVADSTPEGEYQEILDKAHSLVTALELAHGSSTP